MVSHFWVPQLSIGVTKYLREINVKKKGFPLTHGFRGFSTWSLVTFTPAMRQNIMVEVYSRENMVARSKERAHFHHETPPLNPFIGQSPQDSITSQRPHPE